VGYITKALHGHLIEEETGRVNRKERKIRRWHAMLREGTDLKSN